MSDESTPNTHNTAFDLRNYPIFEASQKLALKQSPLGLELLKVVEEGLLQSVFQPIVDLKTQTIFSYEALVRGPFNSVLHRPLNLFNVAEERNVLEELDSYARICSIDAFSKQAAQRESVHLFLNTSVEAVMNSAHHNSLTMDVIKAIGLQPERVVIEITELQPVENFDAFIDAIDYYRSEGFKVAIDDLGSGYNGLRIWSEVRPDYVKVDRHFVSQIDKNDEKRAFMETIVALAMSTGTKVVAEGVETEHELEVLDALGVDYVQGYLFKRPSRTISDVLDYDWPSQRLIKRAEKGDDTVGDIVFEHPTLHPDQKVNDVSEMFLTCPEKNFFPVVDDGKAVGMVWRRELMDLIARRYGPELHGRKSVKSIMDSAALIVDTTTSLDDLSRLATERDEFDAKGAFIVESDQCYRGCGDFKLLLKKMTDLKVQMAQQSNPLSGLPGNMPIQRKLNKLLSQDHSFMVMYIDVDNFKAFNDNYSFDEGDQVITLISRILNEVIPEEQLMHDASFIGHIGGDDFVIMSLNPAQYKAWAEKILGDFRRLIKGFYNTEDINKGGVESVDRKGQATFFPLMSLSIGVLLVESGRFKHRQQLASYATKAKKGAKSTGGDSYFVVNSSDVIDDSY